MHSDSEILFSAYPAGIIRAAENPMIKAAERLEPDGLMRTAAAAVTSAAQTMLKPNATVLLLAGSGGNGGDALYAGANLLQLGHKVHAFGSQTQPLATAAFLAAGGSFVTEVDRHYDLLIDGLIGLGARAGLFPAAAAVVEKLAQQQVPVLAVDIPSGINPDTGEALGVHVTADVTITFGALRLAHTVANACGEVVVADIGIAEYLPSPQVTAFRVVPSQYQWHHPVRPLPTIAAPPSLEPAASDHKYSTGVTGVVAGSEQYPGAGILCSLGAVLATPAMVRYCGGVRNFVLLHTPEVVVSTVATAGKVDAWVVGPGGVSSDDLRLVLASDTPVLIDADGLRLLAQSPELLEMVKNRKAPTVLTPHDGEFRALARAINVPASHRLADCRELAAMLGVVVLLKGRRTLIALGNDAPIISVDAGHSWSATPGSGDVLAGVLGAWLARLPHDPVRACEIAVHVCQQAAYLAAQTPYGPAPVPALQIAQQVQAATALLNNGGGVAKPVTNKHQNQENHDTYQP